MAQYQRPYRRRLIGNYPDALKDVVGKMVTLHVEDRYQTLAAMVEAFRNAIKDYKP